MYQRSRSKSREKPAMADLMIRRNTADGEGSNQFRRRTNASEVPSNSSHRAGSSVEENTVSLEFSRSLSKKASTLPMKMLIGEEVSKGVEIRHPSPSLVARLMGLDTLPPPPPPSRIHKQQGNTGPSHLQSASLGFQQKYAFSEDHSYRRSGDEHPEFKDVFEVMESPERKKDKNQKVRKGKLSSKNSKCDVDFVRQKFIDAKRLSADEALQNSNELNDALEILDMNKDLFLEFLQEPNSLLSRHLQDLNCSPLPSSHGRHARRLRSSQERKCDHTEICSKLERCSLNFDSMSKGNRKSSTKPAASLISHSRKEYSGSLPHRSVMSQKEDENESCIHPTRIVVLKPSLEKAKHMAGAVPLSHEVAQIHYRRTAELPESQNQEIFREGNVQPKLSDTLELLGPKMKGSRELAREITQQMRQTVDVSTRKVLDMNTGNEGSRISSGMISHSNSEALHGSSDLCDDWSKIFSPSSIHSTCESVSKEARERLCERWQMTNRYQEEGLAFKGSSTLGEMLALSDMESPKAAPRPRIYQKASNEKSARDELLRAWVPLGISSKDGWKYGSSSNLPRSKSVPAPSTIRGSPRSRNRKRNVQSRDFCMLKGVLDTKGHDSIDEYFRRRGRSAIRSPKCYGDKDHLTKSFGEENMLPEREIHVNSEELKDSIHMMNLAEVRPMHPAIPGDAVTARNHVIDSSAVPDCQYVTQPSITQKPMASAILAKDKDILVYTQDDMVMEEDQVDNPQPEIIPSPCCAMDSASPVSPEGERPSPVSVLEPPLEEENSCSGCFEGISADLQELRMQLQLLKQGATDTYTEETEFTILSDDDDGEDGHSPPIMGEILQAFRDEEDRDFSYLLDMLIDLGVHGANQDVLFNACYSQDCPVAPYVFDKLEKKYCKLFLWSRSDRKLLFDLINSILADIMGSCLDLQPCMMSKRRSLKWKREDLVEEVWQMVAKQRRDLLCTQEEGILETKWLDLRCRVDLIGKEMEKILHDELLEELVLDLFSRIC